MIRWPLAIELAADDRWIRSGPDRTNPANMINSAKQVQTSIEMIRSAFHGDKGHPCILQDLQGPVTGAGIHIAHDKNGLTGIHPWSDPLCDKLNGL